MPRFAANLSMLFTDAPFLERFGRAARAGFREVEFQFPYAEPAERIRAAMDAAGVVAILHNLPAGNWEAGERGIACHPGRVDEFRAGVEKAIEYARALGVRKLNALAGIPPAGVTAGDARSTLVGNLRHAARRLGEAGLDLLVEPINTRDIPGFFLSGSAQTLALLDEVGEPNAYLQYDVYHLQRMEGELAGTIERHLGRIGHIQIADNPGRHEPGTGEIRFEFLFAHLDRIGWKGSVGCEYKPADAGAMGTEQGLGWMRGMI